MFDVYDTRPFKYLSITQRLQSLKDQKQTNTQLKINLNPMNSISVSEWMQYVLLTNRGNGDMSTY